MGDAEGATAFQLIQRVSHKGKSSGNPSSVSSVSEEDEKDLECEKQTEIQYLNWIVMEIINRNDFISFVQWTKRRWKHAEKKKKKWLCGNHKIIVFTFFWGLK